LRNRHPPIMCGASDESDESGVHLKSVINKMRCIDPQTLEIGSLKKTMFLPALVLVHPDASTTIRELLLGSTSNCHDLDVPSQLLAGTV